MRTFTSAELADILTNHVRWLRGEASGTRAVLTDADLTGADLTRAVLTDAVLTGAVLTDAVLTRAVLTGAVLTDAVLTDAVLTRAVLTGAVLTDAVLTGAVLTGADLTGAVLTRAVLTDAVLTGAVLTDAVLTEAVLTGAVLTGVDLTGAVLTDAVLTGADLTPIRDDIWAVLSAAPSEVAGLRAAIAEGRIDGSSYSGECACLVGTLANAKGCEYTAIPGLRPSSSRAAERFFLSIRRGDTPTTNQASRLALEWVDDWLFRVQAAFAPSECQS